MSRSFAEIENEIALAESRRDVEHLKRLAQELSELHSPRAESAAHYVRGLLCRISGDVRSAIIHHERGIAVSDQHGLEDHRSHHTMGLGIAYLELGELDDAATSFRQALTLAELKNNRDWRASATMSLGIIHGWRGEYAAALELFRRALEINEQRGDELAVAKSLSNIAITYWNTGDLPQALEYFLRALDINERSNVLSSVALCFVNISNVYSAAGNNETALEYLHRALEISTQQRDVSTIAVTVFNIGNIHLHNGEYELALSFARDGLNRYTSLEDQQGIARSMSSVCATYLAMKDYEQARSIFEQLNTLKIEDPRYVSRREQLRAQLIAQDGDLPGAVRIAQEALKTSTSVNLRAEEVALHKLLRDLALRSNDLPAYVEHNERYSQLREDVLGREATHHIAMQESERRIASERAERERERTILYSTLPRHIADRVIRGEQVTDHIEEATVVFIDIVDFTSHTESMDPRDVIALLESVYKQFDQIMSTHGLLKIKTIGDSYMAVALDHNHAHSAVEASIAVLCLPLTWPDGEKLLLRIGVHDGPVVAGVIATERMQYDVWGDTVNVASRLESSGEPGRIHISHQLRDALVREGQGSPWKTTLRGETELKGKGKLTTYWIDR
jgi:class 3 adenylate cyclase/Flp pilus assembly protein TadD